jgi:heptosyltransferase III
MRRLGDVLLATPLAYSLARSPAISRVDALVFSGTEGPLEGNRDIGQAWTLAPGAGSVETLRLARALWRRYDWALAVQGGDRPIALARVAGRRVAGFRNHPGMAGGARARLLTVALAPDPSRHRVEEVLRLADPLGATKLARVIAPAKADCGGLKPAGPYVVLHPGAAMRYKLWHAASWRTLTGWLQGRGLTVCISGSADPRERRRLDETFAACPDVRRLDGMLSWGQIATLLEGARGFAGVDTSVTHLAAAMGVPTVALFGPTDPRLWGPWPARADRSPWRGAGPRQQSANVWLLQGVQECVPCQLEGCERHRESESLCLEGLSAARAVEAMADALAVRSRIPIAALSG